jgi:hypothetical protein
MWIKSLYADWKTWLLFMKIRKETLTFALLSNRRLQKFQPNAVSTPLDYVSAC